MDLSAPAGIRVVDDDSDPFEPRTGLLTASSSAALVAECMRTVRGVGILVDLCAEEA